MGGIRGYTDPERESYCRDIRKEQMSKETLIDNKAIWIESQSGFNIHCNDNYKCSNCGNKEKFATFFCSYCGKEMTSDKEIYWKNWK